MVFGDNWMDAAHSTGVSKKVSENTFNYISLN